MSGSSAPVCVIPDWCFLCDLCDLGPVAATAAVTRKPARQLKNNLGSA